ncbi:DUF4251 domain-containing protein [Marinifilum caeruleilacunae]|uniref:DUF4251 domain-containing protein n=1 Tax=Marinifilum caeruleilacunae TaxID=2499076 RepID=A0ABX1WV23_9BACT|nr:DUF4251 domain-containing protein [Marinifilum caeruleilacunae]NOU59806.1 DUF4251 domain-containing protein [Marinifilum caeruleilacunae]
MKRIIFFLTVAFFIQINFGFAQLTAKEARQQKKELKMQEVQQLVESNHFIFKADALTTSSGYYKDLDYNYDLILANDSVHVYLPYWGRVYMARINDDAGFKFSESIDKLKFKDRGKKGYQISFTSENKGDSYFFTLDVSKLGYAYLKVNSTRKSFISYDGTIHAHTQE